jgi:hypothetical protein
MLCEEARVRWLTVVEKEDVMIDDISAIVLEFSDVNKFTTVLPDRGLSTVYSD